MANQNYLWYLSPIIWCFCQFHATLWIITIIPLIYKTIHILDTWATNYCQNFGSDSNSIGMVIQFARINCPRHQLQTLIIKGMNKCNTPAWSYSWLDNLKCRIWILEIDQQISFENLSERELPPIASYDSLSGILSIVEENTNQ